MGRFHPGITFPARPSGRVRHRNVLCRDSGLARSAAIAVTSLNVDPGGYWPYRARSSISSVVGADVRAPGGSGAGALTIARTSPVVASITTTDPFRAPA